MTINICFDKFVRYAESNALDDPLWFFPADKNLQNNPTRVRVVFGTFLILYNLQNPFDYSMFLLEAQMQRSPTTTGFWWGRLPHWEVEEGRYFVTLRLAGSIPAFALDQIHVKIDSLRNQPCDGKSTASMKIMRSVFRDYEMWLDKSRGVPLLAQPPVANMVRESIDHRIKIGAWVVYDYVVMPNHIHLFLSVLRGTLKSSLIDFKRWTGHQAAKLTPLNQGRFWQNEWFDHWSRSDEQDDRILAYIRHNPVKAGLVMRYENWPYGSWSR